LLNASSAGECLDGHEPSADQIFQRIRSSGDFINKMEGKDSHKEKPKPAVTGDPEIAAATTEILQTESEDTSEASIPKELPTTLSAALSKHKNLDASLSDLWKLLFYLRAGGNGCDVDIVPNALATRSFSEKKGQKWHNKLMAAISRLDAQLKQPAMRQSRQAAWIQHTELERKKLAPTLPPSLEVERSDVVCIKTGGKWQICWVLSIFRNYSARSGGAQLTTMPLPRGSLHSLRVVRSMY